MTVGGCLTNLASSVCPKMCRQLTIDVASFPETHTHTHTHGDTRRHDYWSQTHGLSNQTSHAQIQILSSVSKTPPDSQSTANTLQTWQTAAYQTERSGAAPERPVYRTSWESQEREDIKTTQSKAQVCLQTEEIIKYCSCIPGFSFFTAN